MADLRSLSGVAATAEGLLAEAKLGPGEYLLAHWVKNEHGKTPNYNGATSADITTNTAEKLDFIRRMVRARRCTGLGFVVSSTPGRPINPRTRDELHRIQFFGA